MNRKLIIGLFLSVIIVSLVAFANASDTGMNDSIDSLESNNFEKGDFVGELYVNGSGDYTDDFVAIEYLNDEEIQIRGNIVGSMGGLDVGIANKSLEDNDLYIDIKTTSDKDHIGTTAITGYQYVLKLENVQDVDDIVILHDGKSEETHTIQVES